MANEQNRDKARLDEAVQKLKEQLALNSKKADWKEAYLHGIAYHKQTLNKTRGIKWQN